MRAGFKGNCRIMRTAEAKKEIIHEQNEFFMLLTSSPKKTANT